jgi:hypothetical protein
VDTLLIIGIALFALVDILFALGLFYTLRRRRRGEGAWARHVATADQALEQARAADKGWDRALMDAVAHAAVAQTRPAWSDFDLELVLVDDRPGVTEDRARYVATDRGGNRAELTIGRDAQGEWRAVDVGSAAAP